MSTATTLRITRRTADRLRAGHLWVYRTDLESSSASETLEPGGLVTITDSREIPLGTALYSSASTIAARLVSRTPALSRAQYLADLRTRTDAALQLRRQLAPTSADNNAHRLIFSEADNLPGIIADRYNDLVLLQLLTQGTAQDDVRAVLVAAFSAAFAHEKSPLTIWERPDPRIRELELLPAPAPGPLFTTHTDSVAPDGLSFRTGAERDTDQAAPTTTRFTLNGLHFHYDAASGQKTGAFLDQRLNYAAAARVVKASGRTGRALDICTYQGGFALHLAQVCSHVTGVDASLSALEAADRNLALNPSLTAETEWMEADAFDYLRHLDDTARKTSSPNHHFDAIVLDPPAFAKSKRAAEGALRGYKELNFRALRLLAPGGTLITNSCSHHVSLQDFTEIIASAAVDANRRVQLLETHAAAPDHPEVITLPETRYLKCLICRVD
ncbi:MAG TPA: class I SAM-dependent rRNA methyltransferase [Acidobacteriaceae bacterium]|nr:class I SAM-dependent rRNA methyltransferase [Acidobacteriaceae bacterium]